MAEALKIEGNVYVAAKEWEKAVECYSQALELVKESDNKQKAVLLSNRSWCLTNLNRLKEAVEDGQLCIKLQPNWSKSYLRCGQAYSKQCNYAYAKLAYSAAIRTAETSTIKANYVAALKTIEEMEATARQKLKHVASSATRAFAQNCHDGWRQRVMAAEAQGYKQLTEGAIQMMTQGWDIGAEAWKELDKAFVEENGEINGTTETPLHEAFVECTLLDHLCFAVPRQQDDEFSLEDKFLELPGVSMRQLPFDGNERYFTGGRWTAEEIVADLEERRRKTGDWASIRICLSMLIGGDALLAFVNSAEKNPAQAIYELESAIALIKEGNKVWPGVPYETKGDSFRPTFYRMMRAQLLHYRVEAHQMASSELATTAFSLEAIEDLARELIAESPAFSSSRKAEEKRLSRLGTHIMPTVRAHAALGYTASQRAKAPLKPINLKIGDGSIADIQNAKKAARCYDLAWKLLPNDHHLKPSIGFKALELHLLAGGKTVKEAFRLAEEIEKIRKDLVRFFVHLDTRDTARNFVEEQVRFLQQWLEDPRTRPLDGVAPIDCVLKAMPVHRVGSTLTDMGSVFTSEFWSTLPGDVGFGRSVQMSDRTEGVIEHS